MLWNLELFYYCHSHCEAAPRQPKWKKKGKINQMIWISGKEKWTESLGTSLVITYCIYLLIYAACLSPGQNHPTSASTEIMSLFILGLGYGLRFDLTMLWVINK